jgi:rSAM/selenodomain-associated transferase 2
MLSIIIPVLHEAGHLERLLPDLVARVPSVEIIVVDAGSDEDTVKVMARFQRVRHLQAPRGRARQMNAGAAAATGSILLFLHADTRPPAGFDRAIIEALADPRIVGGRFDVRFDNPALAFRLIAALMNARSRRSGIFTGDQAIFVRRTAFDALGGYPDLPLMEDVELSRRLKRLGRLACLRLRVTTAARKWEQEGVARTIVLMWTLRFLYFCGVAPDRLHRWYYPALAPPDPGARSSTL